MENNGIKIIDMIRPIANKDGTQSLMMIVTRNGKVVEHLTQDLTFVPKGTGNRNFVEWLDAGFSYKMVDPIMGVHTRYPAIDIYRRVGRKRAAAEGLATLDGSLFHLSSDGRNLFSNNLRQITDLGALVTFDTRARLAIQEDPDDLGSWITSSSASSLTLVTLLQVSPNSDMSAREVYKDCLGYDSADLPLHVAYNQITIGDLRNPQVFSMILTHKLKLTTVT